MSIPKLLTWTAIIVLANGLAGVIQLNDWLSVSLGRGAAGAAVYLWIEWVLHDATEALEDIQGQPHRQA